MATKTAPRRRTPLKDGSGRGRGQPGGLRRGRNTGNCTKGKTGRGQGGGQGRGRGRAAQETVMTEPKLDF